VFCPFFFRQNWNDEWSRILVLINPILFAICIYIYIQQIGERIGCYVCYFIALDEVNFGIEMHSTAVLCNVRVGRCVLLATATDIQVMRVFIPSTQRHYRRLILLFTLLRVSVVRQSSSRNILLARITQLTTDPLFLEYS
jgi:hypothetical protein